MFTVQEVLQLAVKMEENGEQAYRQALQRVEAPEIRTLLAWIADEEVAHAAHFRTMLKRFGSAADSPFLENPDQEQLADILQGESLSLKEIDFSAITRFGDLIDVFLEFENDGILFYELLRSFVVEGDARSVVDEIIEQEKSHVQKLTFFADSDTPVVPEPAA